MLKPIIRHDTNHYSPKLLNYLFGEKNYKLSTMEVDPDFLAEMVNTVPDFLASSIDFAVQKEDKFSLIEFLREQDQGWMVAFEREGIIIHDSNKTPKRITTITRDVYAHVIRDYRNGDQPLAIAVVPHDFYADFKVGDVVFLHGEAHTLTPTDVEKFTDGGNLLSSELLTQDMLVDGAQLLERIKYRADDVDAAMADDYSAEDALALASSASRSVANLINQRFLRAAATGQFRLLNEEGQRKGDYILSSRQAMMDGLVARMPHGAVIEDYGTPQYDEDGNPYFDVITFPENLKHEVSWANGTYCFVEPHGMDRSSDMQEDVSHAMTNQQSLAWLQDSLYNFAELNISMKQYLSTLRNKMAEGEIPKFYTEVDKLDGAYSSVANYQRIALKFHRNGLGLENSIYLMNRVMQSVIDKLTSERKERRIPVRCSMYVHIGTDSWLRACGRANSEWPTGDGTTPRGYIWYDKVSHRMIYNDLDFLEDFELHGGWDLDDAYFAHARTYQGERVWINVRSPNTYGEFAVRKYLPGTFHPMWRHTDNNGKSHTVEFPVLDLPLPQDINEIKPLCDYRHTDLSSTTLRQNSSNLTQRMVENESLKEIYRSYPQLQNYQPTGVYTKDSVAARMLTAGLFSTLFGRYVNTMMVWHDLTGSFKQKQLAPLEEVVDASTQDQSLEAAKLIASNIDETLSEIVIMTQTTGERADEALWKRRGSKRLPQVMHNGSKLPKAVVTKSKMITQIGDILDMRIAAFATDIQGLAQRAVSNYPTFIEQMIETRHKREGHMMVAAIYKEMAETPAGTSDERREYFQTLNNDLVEHLQSQYPDRHERYRTVLGMMSSSYTRRRGKGYSDTALFLSSNDWQNKDMLDIYVEALEYFDIRRYRDEPDSYIAFGRDFACVECGVSHCYDNPVDAAFRVHLES